MKLISKILIILILSFSSFNLVVNGAFSDLFGTATPQVNIDCSGKDCNIKTGVEEVKGTITGIETERPLAEYIQAVVINLLTFLSIIAVIYIIYAGFRVLTGGGDEEVLKKQKSTILYVIIGMAIIWLAYPITLFIIGLLNS